MDLDEFLCQAGGHGPCVGVLAVPAAALVVPSGFELRQIDGGQIATLEQLYDAFSHAWRFPPSFVHYRNLDAFNDWMRDFDNLCNPALDRPPAAGYLTLITNAHCLLADEPDVFAWFADHMGFYRDYYRDDLDPAAAFGLLLSAPEGHLDTIRVRWRSAGVQTVTVTT
jgi:hypothetical protein